jgi:CRP/FNR family cyclic AMP-dependent transcriptional regulator
LTRPRRTPAASLGQEQIIERAETYRFARNRVTLGPYHCYREAIMQTVAFKAGDTIIAKGDDGDASFFIVTGSVEVSIGQGAGARTVAVLNEGEVFGEMCLIEPGPRSATVKATTDVECLATSYEGFIGAIEDHPDRAAVFMKALVRRLRQMNEMMESVGAHPRGLRAMIRDWRKSVASSGIVLDAADLWKMLW